MMGHVSLLAKNSSLFRAYFSYSINQPNGASSCARLLTLWLCEVELTVRGHLQTLSDRLSAGNDFNPAGCLANHSYLHRLSHLVHLIRELHDVDELFHSAYLTVCPSLPGFKKYRMQKQLSFGDFRNSLICHYNRTRFFISIAPNVEYFKH